MAKHAEQKSNTLLQIIIFIIIIALIIGGIYFMLQNSNNKATDTNAKVDVKDFKEEKITAENYQNMMDKIEDNMKEDEDLYYLSYSVLYYITKDGISSAFSQNADESAMYVNIYGKTVNQLIEEGKQLMKDNNMTIETYKQQLEKASNQ